MWCCECGEHLYPAWRHRHSEPQAAGVCVWRISLFGKWAPAVVERYAGEMKKRNWARAVESSGPVESPDTLLHIKEKAGDTIVSLGCESPTLLIKTFLLNHPLVSPSSLHSFYHSSSEVVRKERNEGEDVGELGPFLDRLRHPFVAHTYRQQQVYILPHKS